MKRSPISKRQLQKADTRRLILEKAYSLFAEKGYSGTTLRLLAQRAGIGLGTTFKHFPDKPSLLVAAFQEELGLVVQKAFRSLPKQGIRAQLVHITEKIYSFYAKDIYFSRILVKEGLFLEGPPGQILDQQLYDFLFRISELIQAAIQRKELPEGTDPLKGAMVYGSFYFSGLIMGLKQPRFNPGEQSQLVRELIDLFWPLTDLPKKQKQRPKVPGRPFDRPADKRKGR